MENLQHILKPTDHTYDVLAMLSGGKDSVLMLYHLLNTHPDLKVLCITYDDGFLEPIARENAEKACQFFRLDHLTLRQDCEVFLEAYVGSDLAMTVDVYTFMEVFQHYFWSKISEMAKALGDIPVITGNIGYFSSEEFLPDQHKKSVAALTNLGMQFTPCQATFISYWAEENYPHGLSILKEIGWKSHADQVTDNSYLKEIQTEFNKSFPKPTLDAVAEQHWEQVTQPRFAKSS